MIQLKSQHSSNQSPPKRPKKRRNRNININVNTYMAGIWTNRVERGRKCQSCKREIKAGEESLRYIRRDMEYGKYPIQSEKAICSNCAIPELENIIAELKQPIDQTMFNRMKKNQPPQKTIW